MAEVGSVFVSVVPSMRDFSKKIKAEAQTIGDVTVSVSGDTDDLQKKIAAAEARLTKLGKEKVTAEVKADTAAAQAELSVLQRRLAQVSQMRVTAQVHVDTNRATSSLTRFNSTVKDAKSGLASFAKFAAGVGVGSLGTASAINGLVGLAAAVSPAVGALALLPAAAGAAAVGVGTLKLAFQGFGDAIGDDPKKAAEAMAKMAPAAREAATAVNSLKPAWKGLQLDVQGRFFDGLSSKITGLGNTYIPILRGSLAGLAGDLNGSVKDALDVLSESGNVEGITTALGSVREGVASIGRGLAPVTQAFTTLFVHGAPYVAQFGLWVEALARRFSLFIAEASRSGQIEVWIENAIVVFQNLGVIVGNVASILGSVFSAASAAGGSVLDTLVMVTNELRNGLKTPEGAEGLRIFFGAIHDTVVAMMPGLRAIGTAVLGLIQNVAPALPSVGEAFSAIAVAAQPFIDALGWLIGVIVPPLMAFLTTFAPILVPIALAIGGLVLATKAWAIAQGLLNLALSANPIGLVVIAIAALVGGIIWAWNNVGWFRDAVLWAWDKIKIASLWLWENVLKPVFDGISWFITNVVAPAFTWLWVNVIQPVATWIGEKATWLWQNVLKPVFDGIGWIITTIVGPALSWLWTTIVEPVFRFIGALLGWLWRNVLKPSFDGWAIILTKVVGPALSWLWENVVKPVLGWIGDKIGWLWDNVAKPAFDGIKWAFEKLGEGISWVWENVLKPIFDLIGGAIEAVGGAFDWAADKLNGHANGVVVERRSTGGIVHSFAGGGVLSGYAPGHDTIPALLSPGEAVLVPELVRIIGAKNIEAANAAAMKRRAGSKSGTSGFSGFATGGVVQPAAFSGGVGSVSAPVDPTAGTTLTPETQKALTAATEVATAALLGQQDATVALDLASLGLTEQAALLTLNVAATTPQVQAQTAAVQADTTAVNILGAQTRAFQLAVLIPFQQYLAGVMFPTLIEMARLLQVVEVTAIRILMSWFPPLRTEIGNTANWAINQWTRMNNFTGSSVDYQLGRFNNLMDGMARLRSAMAATSDWARTQYGNISRWAADPIRWTLQQPFNAGLIAAWNSLNSQFSMNKPVNPVPVPFASGGPVTGGRKGRDSVNALLMPGEVVFSKKAVDNMGGPDAVQAAHLRARNDARGGRDRLRAMRKAPLDDVTRRVRMAYGGVMPWVAAAGDEITRIFGRMPGGIGGVGQRANASDHPKGLALDFMTMANQPLGDKVAAHLQQNAARLAVKYLIWKQRINEGGGWKGMEDRGSITANHFDHVHASFTGTGKAGAMSGEGGFFDPTPAVDAAFAATYKMIGEITSRFGIGNAASYSANIAKQAADTIRQKALDQLTTMFASSGLMDVSGITGPVVDQVRAVAARYGWDKGPEWDAIVRLVQKESSWNPNAANSRSSARGLFQKMTSYHGPVEPTPAGQAAWGLNYIKGRYGTPTKAWAFHQRNGSYDGGGLAVGRGLMLKETISPERVLSPRQTAAFEGLVPVLQSMSRQDFRGLSRGDLEPHRAGTGTPYVINQQLPAGADPTEFATHMAFAMRRQRMSAGVHGR